MIEETRQCINCLNEIEEPICERCLMKEVISWLRDNRINPKIQMALFQLAKKSLFSSPSGEGYCIVCYNDLPKFCKTCFFSKIGRLLEVLSINNNILNDYLNTFSNNYSSNYNGGH